MAKYFCTNRESWKHNPAPGPDPSQPVFSRSVHGLGHELGRGISRPWLALKIQAHIPPKPEAGPKCLFQSWPTSNILLECKVCPFSKSSFAHSLLPITFLSFLSRAFLSRESQSLDYKHYLLGSGHTELYAFYHSFPALILNEPKF